MLEAAAVLTLKRVPDMTPKGRRDIAGWLRRQADIVLDHGDELSLTKYTARYLYEDVPMPLTRKGKKIKKAMQGTYGKKKGEDVFYASQNKGKIKGTHKARKKGY